MPVVPLAEGDATDGETVLTAKPIYSVGAQGGAAVSLQRGHIVRQTRGLIYYKLEALQGRSGSPLFNAAANRIVGVVAWRTGDGFGLAMNAAQVQSFVRGEVAEIASDLPHDAVPLWQTSTRLVLVTSKGCRPCELQKQSMPPDVKYQTVDIQRVNAKGYNVQITPTLMVFVDGELQASSAGLLRGDGLRSFLKRWGFADELPPDDDGFQSHDDDDRNPWTNPNRWTRRPIRDRIDNAKDRFAWWLLGKWFGYCTAAVAFVVPWLVIIVRASRKLRSDDPEKLPPRPRRRKQTNRRRKTQTNG